MVGTLCDKKGVRLCPPPESFWKKMSKILEKCPWSLGVKISAMVQNPGKVPLEFEAKNFSEGQKSWKSPPGIFWNYFWVPLEFHHFVKKKQENKKKMSKILVFSPWSLKIFSPAAGRNPGNVPLEFWNEKFSDGPKSWNSPPGVLSKKFRRGSKVLEFFPGGGHNLTPW